MTARRNSSKAKPMGLIHASIALSNPCDAALSPLSVRALVDTDAVNLCVPAHVAVQLALAELERREVTVADGRRVLVPYVGPVLVRFENRSCFTGAFVLGESVLLGSIPLDDMDLVVNSRLEKVTVNPNSPDVPRAIVKEAMRRPQAERRLARMSSSSAKSAA